MKRARMDECVHCGALFRRGRLACPECGSDADTGWQDAEEIDYQSIEIPDAWDEGGATAPQRRTWLVVIVVLTVVGLVGAYVVRLF